MSRKQTSADLNPEKTRAPRELPHDAPPPAQVRCSVCHRPHRTVECMTVTATRRFVVFVCAGCCIKHIKAGSP